jgi:hypothetical protein
VAGPEKRCFGVTLVVELVSKRDPKQEKDLGPPVVDATVALTLEEVGLVWTEVPELSFGGGCGCTD